MRLLSSPAIGLLADTVNDASSTRKVYLLAGGLAVLGIALIVITVWFWKSTRHDPELLAPLEAMGSRKFRHMDERAQQHVLDTSRPPNAQPMRWGVVRGEPEEVVELDLRAIHDPSRLDYDDLRDPVESVDSVGDVAGADGVGDVAGVGVTPASADPSVSDPSVSADPSASAESGDLHVEIGRSADGGEAGGVSFVSTADLTEAAAAAKAAVGSRDLTTPMARDFDDVKAPATVIEPLLIVPIDHNLPPSEPPPRPAPAPIVVSSSPLPIAEPDEIEDDLVYDDVDATQGPIDPLLRMFDRNDK